jgi:hypothetical protein
VDSLLLCLLLVTVSIVSLHDALLPPVSVANTVTLRRWFFAAASACLPLPLSATVSVLVAPRRASSRRCPISSFTVPEHAALEQASLT